MYVCMRRKLVESADEVVQLGGVRTWRGAKWDSGRPEKIHYQHRTAATHSSNKYVCMYVYVKNYKMYDCMFVCIFMYAVYIYVHLK